MSAEQPQGKRNILLIEDNNGLRSEYTKLLQLNDFDVSDCSSEKEALQLFDDERFDAVILDLELGNNRQAGYSICAAVRNKDKFVPIIFLSAHYAIADRVIAIVLEADDYLPKPPSSKYLLSRINALIKKRDYLNAQIPQLPDTATTRQSMLQIDPNLYKIKWKNIHIHFSFTQFLIIKYIFDANGAVKTKEEIVKAAELNVAPETIVGHIRNIRNRFLEVDPSFSSLSAEYGRGYRWSE